MDLINDIAVRDRQAREERMQSSEETRLVAAHNGDVLEIEGFQCVRVSTLSDLFQVPKNIICLISDDDASLAEAITRDLDVNGCEFAQLVDIPGQSSAFEAAKWLGAFKQISFVKIMADIADQRLMEESMSKEELEMSMAKKQHQQRARKDGEIRPLADFDRDVKDEDLDETVEA
jgi:hypothetical protein